MSSLSSSLEEFEKQLGLPSDFFHALLDEGDWSFVIKLHAVIEAATSHLLAATLGRDDLLGIFSYLALGDQKTGKIAFGRALNVLSTSDRRFITSLSKIRNELVHDIRNASFSLKEYVAGMDSNQLRQMAEVTLAADEVPTRPPEAVQTFRDAPKRQLWTRAMHMVLSAYEHKTAAEEFHWQNRMMREAMGVDDDDDDELEGA